MDLRLVKPAHEELLVHLQDGGLQADIAVPDAEAAARSLLRTLADALGTGHGECFWPCTHGGQYWWMLKRDAEALEVIVMWSRGGATGWEHVFRATDAAAWIQARVLAELDALHLPTTD